MALIEIKSVHKKCGEKEVLKNINMVIEKGEMLGIIGPTGAGKTTLLRLLDNLEKPTSGKIYFDGTNMNESGKSLMLRRRMAMVFQKPVMFNASVYDNIAYGLKIRRTANIDKKVRDMLKTVGLSGYETRNALTLSGGEMQRVALARTMIIEPEVLLLDEPTANLDPVSTEKIEKLISDIKENGTTVVMATHSIPYSIIDKISVMNKGRICQTGVPDEIFRKPSSEFVANFVGAENIFTGTAETRENITEIKIKNIVLYSTVRKSGKVNVSVRPEDIIISKEKMKSSARNVLSGNVVEVKDKGAIIQLKIDCGLPFTAVITRQSFLDLNINIDSGIYLYFKAGNMHLF
ncbi:MAG: ABC transporter ATP-binding protein [Candidatus Thermoplasmatota archaeon]|nr:ABC transporter ATP-binding protein [Candidatus Thermoplasmatota archaeon]